MAAASSRRPVLPDIPALPLSTGLASPFGLSAEAVAVGVAVFMAVAFGTVVAYTGPQALTLCVSLIAFGLVLSDFRIGVLLLVVMMPVSGSALFPHSMFGLTGLNPLNVLLVGTLGSLLLSQLMARGVPHVMPRPLWWLYIVPMVVAGLIGARHVGDIAPMFLIGDRLSFSNGVGYLRDMLAKPLLMVLFALLVAAATATVRRPERLLVPALVSVWIMGGMALGYVVAGGASLSALADSTQREFLSPLGLHANELGRLYAVAFSLLLFTWAQADRPLVRLVLMLSMALVALALLMTFSRSAFVGIALVIAMFIVSRRNFGAMALALAVVVVILLLLPAEVYERASAGFGGGADEISAGRIDGLWLPLLPEVLNSPVFGHGLASILWSEPMRSSGGSTVLPVTHPHNAYLQALLDMGLLGLGLVCAYFVHVWRSLRRLARSSELSPMLRGFYQGAAVGLLGFLMTAAVDSSLLPKPEQSFLWLAIGMMYGQMARRPAGGA